MFWCNMLWCVKSCSIMTRHYFFCFTAFHCFIHLSHCVHLILAFLFPFLFSFFFFRKAGLFHTPLHSTDGLPFDKCCEAASVSAHNTPLWQGLHLNQVTFEQSRERLERDKGNDRDHQKLWLWKIRMDKDQSVNWLIKSEKMWICRNESSSIISWAAVESSYGWLGGGSATSYIIWAQLDLTFKKRTEDEPEEH